MKRKIFGIELELLLAKRKNEFQLLRRRALNRVPCMNLRERSSLINLSVRRSKMGGARSARSVAVGPAPGVALALSTNLNKLEISIAWPQPLSWPGAW